MNQDNHDADEEPIRRKRPHGTAKNRRQTLAEGSRRQEKCVAGATPPTATLEAS